ncbi:hypothetical protein [Fundidesulfovibrio agrisoli]|uniref:hypothetical protein n=1 Tax=Fundidesulfovibrio agrisoli TaxID=2922717 RepID=UPI001FAB81DF|nr:hypothetical protein [Fundidesulfovibrio agrisoli]
MHKSEASYKLKKRGLSDEFMQNLLDPIGILNPLLDQVHNDHTLQLAIRDGYANIYYRGGSLFKITENKDGYSLFFNKSYIKDYSSLAMDKSSIPACSHKINSKSETIECVKTIPLFKDIIDKYFSRHPKPEREFQQLIVRENNYSSISNESEYFITDIEYAERGLRFDMLAVRWLVDDRKTGKCSLALIELKYGDAALNNVAGISKHLHDIKAFMSTDTNREHLTALVSSQINQQEQLRLLRFNKCANWEQFEVTSAEPEIIIILANHNPRSDNLLRVLNSPEVKLFSEDYNLKFFVNTFCGYAMHSKNMLPYGDFLHLLQHR